LKREHRGQTTQYRMSDDGKTLEAYAAKYNVLSEDLGGFYEVIVPGAFDECVIDTDCTCNIDHDDARLLGRIPNSLKLTADETGLFFTCELPDTEIGNFARQHVLRGDISKCSFAFDVAGENWTTTEDGIPLREITKVMPLYDVAIVIRPAYVFDTEIALRSLERHQRSEGPRENTLNNYKMLLSLFRK
jgi:HK97 family phage prohead protease